MKKILDARMHGFVDYAVVAAFGLTPTILGFTGMPANLCYALAGVHLLVTLLTDMPLGALKIIPMKIHGFIELAIAPTLAALPFIFNFSNERNALYFFIGFGAAVFAAWLVTDYNSGARRLSLVPNQSEQRPNDRKAA